MTDGGHRAAGAVFSPFVSAWNCLGEWARRLQPGRISRNDELLEAKRKIDELEGLLAASADLRKENEELRRLTALPPPAEWCAVLAEVISRDPERWNDQLLVNCGSEEGLVTGAVVLVDGKVFGRVQKCFRHTAEIVTLLSPDCRFGVAIEGTDAVGVLQGAGDAPFEGGRSGFVVDYLPKELEVRPEQMVVTSGLGGWMPPGLPVGMILADAPDGGRVHLPDAARAMIHGIPSVSFGAFHFVSVLVPRHAL